MGKSELREHLLTYLGVEFIYHLKQD